MFSCLTEPFFNILVSNLPLCSFFLLEFGHDFCDDGGRSISTIHVMHEIDIIFVAISLAERSMFLIKCDVKFVVKFANCGKVPVIGYMGDYQNDM